MAIIIGPIKMGSWLAGHRGERNFELKNTRSIFSFRAVVSLGLIEGEQLIVKRERERENDYDGLSSDYYYGSEQNVAGQPAECGLAKPLARGASD